MTDKAQHVILFKFPRELSDAEEKEMFEQVRAWPDEIPGFTGLRFGKDVGGRNGGFAYLLLTEFESEEAHQAYYTHPVHVKFSEWIGERKPEAIRVDYPLNSNTVFE